tara:strand:+ start:386 stop:769 length:384 start_codon:yes stop_codon:yes gene_type:complete
MGASSKNFSEKELSCSCCNKNEMTQETVDALQHLREVLERPLKLSSAYRCPRWNSKVSSTGKTGPHTTGKAIDIVCSGKEAWELLSFAMIRSKIWKGIGISQKGNHNKRFIHLDTIEADNRPWIWSY